MSKMTCGHCGQSFDDELRYCPYCKTPTPEQQDLETAAQSKKFIRLFIALVIFCLVMILWLPRDL